MTGRPAAFNALALASTAKVADSAIAPIRAETLGLFTRSSIAYLIGIGIIGAKIGGFYSFKNGSRLDSPTQFLVCASVPRNR